MKFAREKGMHMRQLQTKIANPNQHPFSPRPGPSNPHIRILPHNNSIYLYAENVIFAILSLSPTLKHTTEELAEQ